MTAAVSHWRSVTWISIFALSAFLLAVGERSRAEGFPVGDELVLSPEGWDTGRPSLAPQPDGGFVAVWGGYLPSPPRGGSTTAVYFRRFASDGSPLDIAEQVSFGLADVEFNGVVADQDGHFVVLWEDTQIQRVVGQRFFSDGSRRGSEFEVSLSSTAYTASWEPSAASDGDGGFLVVWAIRDFSLDPTREVTRGRRVDSNGMAVGEELLIDPGDSIFPSITRSGDGFVLVWQNRSNGFTVEGRRLAADGSAVGADFEVGFGWDYALPAVAADADGDFVVVWHGDDLAEYGPQGRYGIQARRYQSDGTSIGSSFRVNEATTSSLPDAPRLGMSPDGTFVVVWRQTETYLPEDWSLHGRRFRSDGTPNGGQFQVSTPGIDGGVFSSSVRMGDRGEFVVAWDNSWRELPHEFFDDPVLARRFEALLFADGFESGDTSAWNG